MLTVLRANECVGSSDYSLGADDTITHTLPLWVMILGPHCLSPLGWSEAHSGLGNAKQNVKWPKSEYHEKSKQRACCPGSGRRRAVPTAAMRARLTLRGRRRRGDRPPRGDRRPEKAQAKEAGPIGSTAACRARRRWARSQATCRAQATTGPAPRTRDDSDHNETDDAAQATCAW